MFLLLSTSISFAQVTIHLEDFGVFPSTSMPAIKYSADADWYIDANNSCGISGSSSSNALVAAATDIQSIVLGPFNSSAYSTMILSWNGFRAANSPTLTLEFSTDHVNYLPVSFTDVVGDSLWHAVSPVSLPAGAISANTYIRLSYSTNATLPSYGQYIQFDDFKVEGATSGTYYWNGTGAVNLLTSWGDLPTGAGANPSSFFANNQTFYMVNGANATINGNWTVGGALTDLYIGDGTTGINFTVPSAYSFGMSSTATFSVLNNATLTLQNTTLPSTSSTKLGLGSTVNYAQSSPVNIINVAHENLTISGGANKNQTGVLSINGVLNLNGSNLVASSFNLSLNGSITGTGAIQTTSSSKIIIGGTGALGTLTFSSTTLPIICSNLTINRTSGSVVLGSNLKVNGTFIHSNSTFDISGKSLILNGAISFPSSLANGSFKCSATSTLSITGSGAITNNLFIDGTSNSIYDLTLNRSGSSLTIGSNVNIINSITPTLGSLNLNGMVTLKSTSAKKARVGIVGGSISGNLNVETYIPGGSAGWAILGPSGVNGLTVANWDGGSGSSSAFAMTCTGCINNPSSTGGWFVSVQNDATGTGTTFTELTSSSALTPGVGTWVYVANSLSSAIDITQTTSGSVVSGNVSSSNGLKANPYPSPISVGSLQGHNGTLSSVDIYNANTGNYTSYNGGIPSDEIPMGQGFYANGIGAGLINFSESDKIAGNTSLSRLAATTTSIGSVFQLYLNGPYDNDRTYLRFHGSATSGFDRTLDAYKRYSTPGYLGYPGAYSYYTTIATVNSNQDYSINSLPPVSSSNIVMPVVVKVSATGQYTISPIDLINLPSGSCVILKDKLLGVNHNLRTGSYVCNISDTTSAPRFELTICADPSTVGVEELNTSTNSLILINQDLNGAYVHTNFETSTKATISAYNMMGQKLMSEIDVEGKQNTTYLNLGNIHSQVVIIKVTTAKETSIKKLFVN